MESKSKEAYSNDLKHSEERKKLVPELVNISYTDRLKMLNLPTLKYIRKRGDLIQVFKKLNGHYDINWKTVSHLILTEHNTRGHSNKLVKHRTLTSLRQKSFFVIEL